MSAAMQVLFRVLRGTSRRTTRLRARSRNVFGAEYTGRRSLVTRDSDKGTRPTSRLATRATPRAAETWWYPKLLLHQ